MTVEEFFSLFMEELKINSQLTSYYKFLEDDNRFLFRKAYFCQRLEYIYNQLEQKNNEVLDVGCGYGTTALFLAMNGYKVKGLTLEFYDEVIPDRVNFWKNYGDSSLFSWSYQNIYDDPPESYAYENIIAQDTLHHLEPCSEALSIINNSLKSGGKFIVVEENGDNLLLRALLYKQRGNRRIIKVYDEKLGKEILLGNENVRGLSQWKNLLSHSGLTIHHDSVKFFRYYFPRKFNLNGYAETILEENSILSGFLNKYFFYSLCFVARKK